MAFGKRRSPQRIGRIAPGGTADAGLRQRLGAAARSVAGVKKLDDRMVVVGPASNRTQSSAMRGEGRRGALEGRRGALERRLV